jgi:hypothetical protein
MTNTHRVVRQSDEVDGHAFHVAIKGMDPQVFGDYVLDILSGTARLIGSIDELKEECPDGVISSAVDLAEIIDNVSR